MKAIFMYLSILILFLTSTGWSQSPADAIRIRHNVLGFGARNLAMGLNGVVTTEDYSAIYWNPAGLATLQQNEFTGEFSHLRFDNQATFSGTLTDMNESYTRLRSLGLALPLPTTRGSLVLGFGYNFVRDFDQYVNFRGFNQLSNGLEFELEDDNGNFNWYSFDRNVFQTEEVVTEGGIHQWSFAAAVAVAPTVDVGATVNFWRGQDEYRLQFRQEDTEDFYTVYPGDFHSYSLSQNLITDYSAFSLKLGGMFRLNQFTRLGMAIEFPTTFTLTENYSSSDELVFDDGFTDAVEFEPGEWKYEVQTPYRFDAGLGFKLENLILSGSATYQDWSQTRFKKPDDAPLNDDYSDLLEENTFLRQDYRETINYHLGGEFRFPRSNFSLRGGYAVYPSPIKDATAEMDRTYYSGGIGLKIGRNTNLDLTYLRGTWKRETEDIYTPGGTMENITENRLFMGIRYHF